MTTTSSDGLYLDPDQQDLLLRALQSNSDSRLFTSPSVNQVTQSLKHNSQNGTPDSMGSQYGNGTPPPTAALNGSFADDTPLMGGDLDYPDWDADGPWDFETGLDGVDNSMNGTSYSDTPGSMSQDNDKRKSPPSNDDGSPSSDPHDAEPKRRESDGTTAKRPGRKPLTSEPTSKRKAQNRAAQRAFRERKEKHLKDLEQKVTDLEKASESANHENSLLRAQVDRLQVELKDYRRRLHQAQKTPTLSAPGLFGKSASTGGFQFEFPMFGGGIGSPFGRQGSGDGVKVGPGTLLERMSAGTGASASPKIEDKNKSTNAINDDIFANYGLSNDSSGGSASVQNTPRLNGGSRDFTSSPSASSVSQHGPGSSCGTSPEPMNLNGSNDQQNNSTEDGTISIAPNGDRYICKSGPLDGETEITFCEKLGMACGNPHNPIPKAVQLNNNSSAPTPTSLDWLTQQNGGNFDPVLFNDYRDPINEINAGINMSFFEDAFPMTTSFEGIESPFALKKDLVAEADRAENGGDNDDDEDEVVPAEDPKKMLSCNKIWDHISAHPKFANGELDMDTLCSELRNKAKCSETGVVVAESDVRDVLTKVGVQSIDFH
ncbi:uncharacterized protein H6S33_000486 [Morchella sextelata]|uniref:uncharacterized protein n=1 Tax=Morchella sextelata TaxID=1174677 RepID=UPI001D04DC4F|nr:uncharacterized protein H6S33_000486 [Morchella sextelata]KAH0614850.1 hypothetical protein H6S33_000486 [Morchella sextelata]